MPLAPPPGFDPITISSDDSENDNIVPGSGSDESGPDTESDGDDPKICDLAVRKSKKRAAAGGESSAAAAKRRKRFNRLFSEADDIALLKGMIEFAETEKSSPLDNLDGLLELVRPRLECDPSKGQLKDKVSKFRWKFIRNSVRERLGGDKARRLCAHEQRAFDLSKLVWDHQYIRNDKFQKSLDAAMKKGIPKKKKSKAKKDEAMDEEKKKKIALVKVTYKKACLLSKQTKIVLDALENE